MSLPNSNLEIEYTTRVKKKKPELGDLGHVPIDVEIVPKFEDYFSGEDSVLNYILSQQLKKCFVKSENIIEIYIFDISRNEFII